MSFVRRDKTNPLLQSLQALVTTELDKCLDELESKVRLDNVHSRQIKLFLNRALYVKEYYSAEMCNQIVHSFVELPCKN